MTISDFVHLHKVNWHQSWTQNSSWVNWAPKRVNTVKFTCVPFESKFKFLKDFSNSVCLIGDYLWSKLQEDQTIFWRVRTQQITKRDNFMDAGSIQKTFLFHNHKVFLLAKYWGVSRRVQQDVSKILVPISTIWCIILHVITGPNFKQNWQLFGTFCPKIHPKVAWNGSFC